MELLIQARGDFTPQSVAQDVGIKVPVLRGGERNEKQHQELHQKF
jgi:hypothetical protein